MKHKWFIVWFLAINVLFGLSEFKLTQVNTLNGDFKDISIDNDKLYGLTDKVLNIYSIKKVDDPILLSTYKLKRHGEKIDVYNGYLYMGDGGGNAIFFNVQDIYDIYIEFSYSNQNHQNYGIVIKDSLVYEANGKKGVNIINIKDPYNAFVLSSYTDLVDARDVDIKGNFLYVADGPGGLKILNVENPQSPYFVREVKINGFANSIKVNDNYAFVAAEDGGLYIYDVSNPYAPIKVPYEASLDFVGANALAFKDKHLYVSLENKGIEVLKTEVREYQISKEDIEPFIKLLYSKILGREADESGLNYWILEVQKGRSATSIAKYFFDSPEFKSLNLSDEEFLERAYATLLNRSSDPAGIRYWLNQMKNGVSKEQIFYGFAFSKEFQKLAGDTYKITPFDQNDQLKAFVGRFYNFVLERDADESGRSYWVDKLKNGEKSAKDIALGFFNSKEFKNKNVSNERFIKIVYKTLLGRDADDNGLKYWIGELEKGVSREKIILKFLSSKEFKKIANSYGLSI